ncbi:MAG: type II toxin-antitoxin system mRNA interferase toxin, RelE/StbE family [Geopsychrobacter sp.]|nr:type II toxin-antitoxin system mRNA interferase toxin, RelE/StbE family [Geopsychrobacter sp.]
MSSLYRVVTPRQFLRQARKFFRKHPDFKPRFAKTVQSLLEDPFRPQLALHSLSGKLSGLYAVSLTHSYRITLTLLVSEEEIVLLDIGSHDEVYR